VHNLTVADLHTFYVQAGDEDILTHNCAASKPSRWKDNRDRYKFALRSGFEKAGEAHDKSAVFRQMTEPLPEPWASYASAALHAGPFVGGFVRGWRQWPKPPKPPTPPQPPKPKPNGGGGGGPAAGGGSRGGGGGSSGGGGGGGGPNYFI
jgi:uncharacterized membrane protein YgcG